MLLRHTRPSRTDRVTGLLDFAGLHERLEGELAVGARRGQAAALLVVELPGRARRELLRWAAFRLPGALRPRGALPRHPPPQVPPPPPPPGRTGPGAPPTRSPASRPRGPPRSGPPRCGRPRAPWRPASTPPSRRG